MVQGENFLFHSSLSSSLNIGLITPKQVIEEIEKLTKSQTIPLNSLEGFVRQVIGWREFIRGIYQQKPGSYPWMTALKVQYMMAIVIIFLD